MICSKILNFGVRITGETKKEKNSSEVHSNLFRNHNYAKETNYYSVHITALNHRKIHQEKVDNSIKVKIHRYIFIHSIFHIKNIHRHCIAEIAVTMETLASNVDPKSPKFHVQSHFKCQLFALVTFRWND